jgi:hypothetical protein
MSDLTTALPTLISPPFDLAPAKRLEGCVERRERLTPAERDSMYELLETYFRGTTREQFESDLAEKDVAILLRDLRDGRLRGFSTLMRMNAEVGGQNIVAFFSGDTIVSREFWGETLLSRLWSQTIFAETDRILKHNPETRVYWFLICSGYKTWKFLPVFFRKFYPNPQEATPLDIQNILDTLGKKKFGSEYSPKEGVVRFRSATPLREGVADVTEERLRDPLVGFFHRTNPGHARGDELACVTEISRSNLTRAGERMVGPRLMQRGTE